MKKILAVLLVLAMMLMSITAFAEEDAAAPMWMYDELNFNVNVEGLLEGDVTIPASINENTTYALQYSACKVRTQ